MRRNLYSLLSTGNSATGNDTRAAEPPICGYTTSNKTLQNRLLTLGSDQIPTWSGDNIFFASDRDLKLNIWKYNTLTKETTQVTHHKEFDVMGLQVTETSWYENGGYLYKLNLQSGQSENKGKHRF